MAPRIAAIAQSEAKSRFVERLGLDVLGREHIYILLSVSQHLLHRSQADAMEREAASAWSRLMCDRGALLPSLRDDMSVQPPYSINQISETALHREVLKMYRLAGPETKPYYDLAHDIDVIVPDNWACRWLLWHAFRNRDQRKKVARDQARNVKMMQAHQQVVTPPLMNPGRYGFSLPYDPIRDS